MSISDTPTPPTAQAARTAAASISLAAEDEEELRKLDHIFKRIRTNIPDAPYIITVPCAEPRYHHWSREQAESWCRNTPFDPSEERLQYMSFLYRDHADSCFVCRTEVDEERDRRAAMKPKSVPSGTSTPRSDAPKKKISLAAYSNKNKQANGLPPKPGPVPDHSKKDAPASGSKTQSEKAADAPKAVKKEDISFAMSETEEEKPLPVKKTRATTPPAKQSRNADNSLPPLISPITSPNALGLPPLLSPTLPDIIEAELEKLAERHKRHSSNTSVSSEHKSGTPLLGPEIRAHQSSTPSKSTSRLSDKRPPNPKADESEGRHRALEAAAKHSRLPSQTSAGVAKPSQDRPRRLIVKLKYGRKRRQDVERCLKLPPGRKARHKDQELPNEESRGSERVRKSEGSSRNKELPSKEGSRKSAQQSAADGKDNKARHVAEKRPRPPDDSSIDVPPSKRPRAPSNLDLDKKPRTPVPPSTQSPSLPNKPGQKAQYLTPRKETKSTSMMRTISNDSNGVTSTPGQVDTPSDAKGPASGVNGRPSEGQFLTSNSRRLNELGRRLKHESATFCDPRNQPSLRDRKRGAVMSVECILAYMAAYYSSDYKSHLSHLPADLNATWRTLFPLFRFFRNNCQEFPHLEGLRLQLGAIICARITTIAAAHRPSQPGEGAEKGGFTAEKALSTMSEHIQNMVALVAESRSKLPFEDIISHYPKTWEGRARGVDVDTDPRGWEKLEPGSLDGSYSLPLGPDTSPIQAVRMGISLLNEWMSRENIDYKLQLKL